MKTVRIYKVPHEIVTIRLSRGHLKEIKDWLERFELLSTIGGELDYLELVSSSEDLTIRRRSEKNGGLTYSWGTTLAFENKLSRNGYVIASLFLGVFDESLCNLEEISHEESSL